MTERLRVEKLARHHAVEGFESGQPDLDRFLTRHALQAQQSRSSQTYVASSDSTMVGFYTLVAGEVRHADASERPAKGMPRHPIPIIVLARLAVHKDRRGRRIGSGLLLDAARRTLQVADIVGVRALIAHAKDDAAVSFYEHFGFAPSSTDPRHLYLLVKDIRAAAGE